MKKILMVVALAATVVTGLASPTTKAGSGWSAPMSFLGAGTGPASWPTPTDPSSSASAPR